MLQSMFTVRKKRYFKPTFSLTCAYAIWYIFSYLNLYKHFIVLLILNNVFNNVFIKTTKYQVLKNVFFWHWSTV